MSQFALKLTIKLSYILVAVNEVISYANEAGLFMFTFCHYNFIQANIV